MQAFEQQITEQGYLAMEGQHSRYGGVNRTQPEGCGCPLDAQDRGQNRYRPDGTPLPQIATPVLGDKNPLSIDRSYGLIRKTKAASAADSDGRQLRDGVDMGTTVSDLWADSACRSQRNERWLACNMLTSRIHRRKPRGGADARLTSRANAARSAVRAKVEHVFAHQKNRYGLFIHAIGPKRAGVKLTLANLAYNFERLIVHERGCLAGQVRLKSAKRAENTPKKPNIIAK